MVFLLFPLGFRCLSHVVTVLCVFARACPCDGFALFHCSCIFLSSFHLYLSVSSVAAMETPSWADLGVARASSSSRLNARGSNLSVCFGPPLPRASQKTTRLIRGTGRSEGEGEEVFSPVIGVAFRSIEIWRLCWLWYDEAGYPVFT